jgi:septum formation protein
MLPNEFSKYNFLLGSKSPRRQHLLKELGLKYSVIDIDIDEIYPQHLKGGDIAKYLCGLKADTVNLWNYPENTILVTADTIVWLNGKYIGKPSNKADAIQILEQLSGKQHHVYTGICLRKNNHKHVFTAKTAVQFNELTSEEIQYYVSHHRPFDKAGAYGIQDWIGYIGIIGIQGCYYNVMGFPVQLFYKELQNFIRSFEG